MKHGGDAFELLPEPATEPAAKQFWKDEKELEAYRVSVKKWADKTLSFDLSPKQLKAVKACLVHYFSQPKSVLPAGKYTNALISAFEIEVKEEDEDKK